MKFNLTKTQAEWFSSKATELAVGGAAGSGKSHFLRIASIIWAIEIPNLQIALFRRISSDLHANHIDGPTGYPNLLAEYIQQKYVKYNVTNSKFIFWNGSQISLCHLQQDKDKYKYQGQEFNLLMIDELTHFTESMYRFLRSRVRMAGKDQLPDKYRECFPRIVCSTNPGGIGHNFVKKSFVDLGKPKTAFKMPSVEGGFNRAFYPATIKDNPYLFENDPDYVHRLQGLGNPEMVKAFLEGSWDILSGSMFDDVLDWNVHCLDARWHKWGIEGKNQHYFDRAFDWGYSAPSAVLWCMTLQEDYFGQIGGNHGRYKMNEDAPPGMQNVRVFKKGSIIVIDELYTGKANDLDKGLQWSPRQIAEAIRDKESNMPYTINAGPADNSIWNADTNIAAEMSELGVHWTPSDKKPYSRIRGWQRMREMMQNASVRPPELPGLYITENCTNLLRTMMMCERDKNNPDDIDTRGPDHLVDALRYKVTAPVRKVSTSKVIGF